MRQIGTGLSTIVRTWRQVERTPPVVVNDPGRKAYQLNLGWQPVVRCEDAFWRERLGASVSPDEARILAWLRQVGPRATARLATGATARETRDLVERLLVNRLIEPVDEGAEHIRLAAHIGEILAVEVVGTPEAAPEVTPQVTPEVMRVLSVLDGERGRREIQGRLKLSDEKHFRAHYLRPATEAGLIEMTIPGKPRSSRQKYRLTDAGCALLARLAGGRS